MSGGTVCRCPERLKPLRERLWRVTQRNQNCSAFNGYHPTYSDWSEVRCLACHVRWRTRAYYVDRLTDIAKIERDQCLACGSTATRPPENERV